MSGKDVMGRISAVQTLGTLDGPGVRFVVFTQGCPLRCGYCHNPETWDVTGGEAISAAQLFERILRYKNYFGADGGVTVSGGEPLMQPEFVLSLFSLCRDAGIHTALDTSGCIFNDRVAALLDFTDLVLLDIKMTTDAGYRRYIGCGIDAPLLFLDELDRRGIDAWVRHVVVSGISSDPDSIRRLYAVCASHRNIKKIELLPFRKLCLEKYDRLRIPFPFGHIPETSQAEIESLEKLKERQVPCD
jgi:pyruvate formate lyase activating enzyme